VSFTGGNWQLTGKFVSDPVMNDDQVKVALETGRISQFDCAEQVLNCYFIQDNQYQYGDKAEKPAVKLPAAEKVIGINVEADENGEKRSCNHFLLYCFALFMAIRYQITVKTDQFFPEFFKFIFVAVA